VGGCACGLGWTHVGISWCRSCGHGSTGIDLQLLFALVDFGFMVNLFNLLLIGSMDGGQIASALSKYTNVAGLGGGKDKIGNYHSPVTTTA